MHLFLDTSIYLGFYDLSGDDLEELEKLAVAVRSGETVLYLTEHVRDEFHRNRGRTISASLRSVETAQIPKSFPRLLQNLDGYDEMRGTLQLFEEQRAALVEQARAAAVRSELRADRLIAELFGIARGVELTDAVWGAAQARHLLGNPPGKKDSIGDAVNWESLLAAVPDDAPLSLVTADNDYISRLDAPKLDEFLVEEWHTRKRALVSGYTSLTVLFRERYPDIRLAADLEKELSVDALVASESFRATHLAIQRLSAFSELTLAQAQALVDAAESNTQIRQILLDRDVQTFYANLADRFADQLPSPQVEQLRERLRDPLTGDYPS